MGPRARRLREGVLERWKKFKLELEQLVQRVFHELLVRKFRCKLGFVRSIFGFFELRRFPLGNSNGASAPFFVHYAEFGEIPIFTL